MSFIILNWLDEPVLYTGTEDMFDTVARYDTLEEAEEASDDVEDPQIINSLAGDLLLGQEDIEDIILNILMKWKEDAGSNGTPTKADAQLWIKKYMEDEFKQKYE